MQTPLLVSQVPWSLQGLLGPPAHVPLQVVPQYPSAQTHVVRVDRVVLGNMHVLEQVVPVPESVQLCGYHHGMYDYVSLSR